MPSISGGKVDVVARLDARVGGAMVADAPCWAISRRNADRVETHADHLCACSRRNTVGCGHRSSPVSAIGTIIHWLCHATGRAPPWILQDANRRPSRQATVRRRHCVEARLAINHANVATASGCRSPVSGGIRPPFGACCSTRPPPSRGQLLTKRTDKPVHGSGGRWMDRFLSLAFFFDQQVGCVSTQNR